MNSKRIEIKCKGNRTVPLEKLLNFQGNLKELRKDEYYKLRKSIINNGIIDVIKVWKHGDLEYILDGHQRTLKVLSDLKKEGFFIPELPVSDTFAKDEKEAKKFLLLINSRYGKMTDEGLYEFIETAELKLDDFKEEIDFGDVDLDYFEANYYKEINLDSSINNKSENTENLCPKCGFKW